MSVFTVYLILAEISDFILFIYYYTMFSFFFKSPFMHRNHTRINIISCARIIKIPLEKLPFFTAVLGILINLVVFGSSMISRKKIYFNTATFSTNVGDNIVN
jgi:hypothetical protein